MRNKITQVLTTAGALLIASVALQGSAAAQVTVYADINYSGNSRTFNGDVPNMLDQGFNDTVSSIQIPRGEQWQFCEDVNFGGRCQTIQGSIGDLRNLNWNDRISSMRRVRGGFFGRARDGNYPGATGTSGYTRARNSARVFDNPNFRGRSVVVNGAVNDLRQYNMNDVVTSIEIPNGETWEICQDIDFGNQCTTISGSVADLRSMGWNDRISSMRQVDARNYRNRGYDGGVYNNNNQYGLLFFDRPNFGGRSTLVTNNGSFGNVARSVRVQGGGVWRVCDNTGDCATIDRDVNNLNQLGLNGRITSVSQVNRRFIR